MLTRTISNELLAIGAKTPLVGILRTYVTTMRELWPDWPHNRNGFSYSAAPWKEATTKLVKDIRDTFGVKLSIEVLGGGESNINAGVWSSIRFFGHSGSRWYDDPALKIAAAQHAKINEFLEIDLEKVTVRGQLVDVMHFNMNYTEALMFNPKMFTVEEVVAVLAHECGHIMNVFMTLGDYVWLNYYLTDGIEILLGKKQNKFKLQILSDAGIAEFVPEAEREAFINDRNEENAKRVILSLAKNAPRHHLTDNKFVSIKREEQLADMFASRLGLGRAFASFEHKANKYFGHFNLKQHWLVETLKTTVGLIGVPFAVLAAIVYDPMLDFTTRYDDTLTRMSKMRRDLVAQLKGSPAEIRDDLVKDIEAIDLIMKEYSTNRGVFEAVIDFLRPSLRKMKQNTRMEDDLESLFHNDLFVQAFKLSKV